MYSFSRWKKLVPSFSIRKNKVVRKVSFFTGRDIKLYCYSASAEGMEEYDQVQKWDLEGASTWRYGFLDQLKDAVGSIHEVEILIKAEDAEAIAQHIRDLEARQWMIQFECTPYENDAALEGEGVIQTTPLQGLELTPTSAATEYIAKFIV